MQEHNIEISIVCSALCWGKIYLGLQTGYVAVFNLKVSLPLVSSRLRSDVLVGLGVKKKTPGNLGKKR